MDVLLDFSLFIEHDCDGLWKGYACNNEVKTPHRRCSSFNELQQSLEYDILCHHCRLDMGASYIVDKEWLVKFYNLPAMNLTDCIQRSEVDYGVDGTVIANTKFDGREAQVRVNVKTFKHYSLCKIIGIYVEPNLLTIN